LRVKEQETRLTLHEHDDDDDDDKISKYQGKIKYINAGHLACMEVW